MVRKLIGLIMLLFGLTGIVASVIGARFGIQVVDGFGTDLSDALQLVSRSLDQVESSLLLAQSTLSDIGDGLNTLEVAAGNLSLTVEDTQPLLSQISAITSAEVPDSIESVEAALPGIIQVAGIIDDTLTRLNDFRVERQILGVPIQFDLGIDYNPELPFDEAVQQVGSSLEDLPRQLRGLEADMDVTRGNLALLSEDLKQMGSDLDQIGVRISQTEDVLNEYQTLVVEINDSSRQLRSRLAGQLQNARRLVTLFAIWIGLGQLAPLYLGWELVKGRRLR